MNNRKPVKTNQVKNEEPWNSATNFATIGNTSQTPRLKRKYEKRQVNSTPKRRTEVDSREFRNSRIIRRATYPSWAGGPPPAGMPSINFQTQSNNQGPYASNLSQVNQTLQKVLGTSLPVNGVPAPFSEYLSAPLMLNTTIPFPNLNYLDQSKREYVMWYNAWVLDEIKRIHHETVAWRYVIKREAAPNYLFQLRCVDVEFARRTKPLIDHLPPDLCKTVPQMLLYSASQFEFNVTQCNPSTQDVRDYLARGVASGNFLDFTCPNLQQLFECMKEATTRGNVPELAVQNFIILSQSFQLDIGNPLTDGARIQMLKSLTGLSSDEIFQFFKRSHDALFEVFNARKFFFKYNAMMTRQPFFLPPII